LQERAGPRGARTVTGPPAGLSVAIVRLLACYTPLVTAPGAAPVGQIDILFLSKDDVDALDLDGRPDIVLDAVEASLRAMGEGKTVMGPRDHLLLDDRFGGHFNLIKGYVEPLATAGVKVVGDYVHNHRHGLPSELALLTLYRPETGVPFAIMDATAITWMRTGAVTAIGAKHLAPTRPRVLGHVGARGTARYNVRLLDHLFGFEEIRVTSRRAESREAFAAELSAVLGKPVVALDSVEAVVRGADIVVEATRLEAPEPILRTEWLAPGCLLVPYGTVSALELSVVAACDKLVVDDRSQMRAGGAFGALRPHMQAGLLTESQVHAELGEIVAGRRPGREAPGERILFWHRGLSITDVALGRLAYDLALERRLGRMLTYARW
jgi:ornithine cyclodeaminase